jgi:hypothetical protein
MNIRKKLIIGIPVVLLSVFALLAAVPFLFKDRILAKAREAINAHLNARVDFSDVSLSLFRNFPDISLCLYDLKIQGTGLFEGVTLLEAPTFEAGLDLSSAIRSGAPLKVHSIKMRQPKLRLLVAADGSANYLILKAVPEAEVPLTAPSALDSTRIIAQIESFQVESGSIWFEDALTGFNLILEGMDHSSSGNVTASVYDLETRTQVEKLSAKYGSLTYLKEARATMDAAIRVNQATSTYTLARNTMQLNALTFQCDGFLRVMERGYAMDLQLGATKNQFRDIFSLIPGAYLQGYESVSASGTFDLKADIKGVYDDSLELFPAYDLQLQIQDGKIKYPDLPLAISGVHADLRIFNPVSDPDSMQVDAPTLRFTVGRNPISGKFHLRTPVSDPLVDAAARGKLDLGELAKAFPMPELKGLQGQISADLTMQATMSQVERKQYEKLDISGHLKATDVVYPQEGLPPLKIGQMTMAFSPQFVRIDQFSARVGRSDFEGNGRIDNILAYFSPKKTMRGQLFLRSNRIDANEFLQPEASTPSAPSMAANIPLTSGQQTLNPPFDRFDFRLDAAVGQVLFQTHDIRSLQARGQLMPNRFVVEALSARVGESDLQASGTITNAFDYLFEEGVLGGKILLQSKNLDLNPFMSQLNQTAEPQKKATSSGTVPAPQEEGVFLIPKNIALVLEANIGTLRYAQYTLKNLSGNLDIQDRAVALRDIRANTFGGALRFSGLYETPEAQKPLFNAKLELDKMDFAETFQAMNTFQALAPVGKFVTGTLNSSILLEGRLGQGMMPDLEALSLKGFLQTLNGSIKGYKPLQSLANALNIQELKGDIPIEDSKNWIEVKQGIVEVKPFDLKIGDMGFTIGGKHSLKQNMEYDIKARIPWKKFEQTPLGNAAGPGIRQIREQAARLGIPFATGAYVEMLIHMSGSIKEPKFAYKVLGTTDSASSTEDPNATNMPNGLETAKKAISQKAEAEIARFDSQARAGAGKIADSLARKAREQADRTKAELSEKAREALEKEVGKTLGDTLGKTIQRQAEKVLDTQKAKAEADKLKKELEKFNPLKKKVSPPDTSAKKEN